MSVIISGFHADHINHNTLGNQRENLRSATMSQNQSNKGLQRNSKSGFMGVSWNEEHQKWIASIKKNGKDIYLGLFSGTEEGKIQAAKAYDRAKIELHGDDIITLNFPRSIYD